MVKLRAFIPVHLIQKPIEYAIIAIWLASLAQFYNFAVSNLPNISLDWFVVAFALMIATFWMAIRFNVQWVFLVIFILGGSAILLFFNPEWDADNSVLIISVYSLFFWLFWNSFLNTSFFINIYSLIHSNKQLHQDEVIRIIDPYIALCFYLSFFTLNMNVILALFLGIDQWDINNIGVFSLAIIFLFVAEKFISERGRGILLPLYMTFLLMTWIGSNSHLLFIWSFILWGIHNGMSIVYNQRLPNKKIKTDLWPWYGLLMALWLVFNHFHDDFVNRTHLLLLTLYLLLMLRNSTLLGLRHFFVVGLVSVFMVFTLPDHVIHHPSILMSHHYAQIFLFFALLLLAFNVLWDAYLNPILMRMGWTKVSLKPMIIAISFTIGLFYLMLITMTIPSFITYGVYNISVLFQMILLFFVLYLFIANPLMAHLNHFSVMLVLIILWQNNQAIPIYLLLALFYIAWIIVPRWSHMLFNTSNRTLAYPLQWNAETLINTSMTWVIVSFIASVIGLLYELTIHIVSIPAIEIFLSLFLLFSGSVILLQDKKQTKMAEFWHFMAYLLMVGLVLSMRLLLMGSRSLNEWDTIGVLVISFIFYKIKDESLLSSKIINAPRLALLLPLFSLFTIPWNIGSIHSSLTLFVLGAFYFAIKNKPESKQYKHFIHYGAFLLLNLGIYLWIPLLSNTTGLLLFYAMPVAISVLLITSLHHNEIKSNLQYHVRLVTLGLFYLVIISDVFMNDSLMVFMIALIIAFASIVYGISRRNRAFLYTGIGFLIAIIIGQLLLFYPEGRLARALILMLFGAMITGIMIWFNIKREVFLSKIQLFRADLLEWD